MQKKVSSFGEGPNRGSARKDDSGLIDLDALMRQASESERDVARAAAASSSTPAAVPAATPAAAVTPAAAPAVAAPAVAAPAVAAPVRKPNASVAVPPVREPNESLAGVSAPTATSSRRGYAVAVAAAMLLCASAVGYRASRNSASPAAATASTAARAEAKPATRGPVEAQPATPAPAAPEIGASDLPSAPPPAEEQGAARGVHAAHGTVGAARARNEQPARPVDPKVSALVLPDSPTRDPSDLGAAMRGAVGANAAQAVDPATVAGPASSARTLRPAPGAVLGAINGVLSGARACLGQDDPVTHASVTFKNDGTVSGVDISGDRPTNGCVRASLSKAHIEPFADDKFVTRVTVRP